MGSVNQLEIVCTLRASSDSDTQYLFTEIFVDGQIFTDFTYYAVDWEALVQSINKDGQFYIITCWCGVPGFAGIVRGINVLHEQGLVYWLITQPRPSRTLIFEPRMYENAIGEVVKRGQQLFASVKQSNQELGVVPMQNEKLLALR